MTEKGQSLQTEIYIKSQLNEFNVTDAKLEELNQAYMPLEIKDVNDKKGFLVVSEARKLIKSYRVSIEKKRKELVENPLRIQKAINAEAKRVTEKLEEIENCLLLKENNYEKEIEKIKIENQKKMESRVQERANQLSLLGFKYDFLLKGFSCAYDESLISSICLESYSDDAFNLSIIEPYKQKYASYLKTKLEEEARIKEEKERLEKQQKEELDRKQEELNKIRIQQELEKKRLDNIARIQKEKELELKKEEERIECLKRYEESKLAVIECEKECESEKLELINIYNNVVNDSFVYHEKYNENEKRKSFKMTIELFGFNEQTYLDINRNPISESTHLEFDNLLDCLTYIKKEFVKE